MDFPGSPVVKILLSNAGAQIRSLVGKLRSHYLQKALFLNSAFICTIHWTLEFKTGLEGMSLAFQWLRLHAFKARNASLIPGQGTKILHVL